MEHNPYIKDIYKESVAYAKAHTRYNKDGLVIVEPDNDDEYDVLYQELLKEDMACERLAKCIEGIS